jgi:flagellar basal body rod protein FlgG
VSDGTLRVGELELGNVSALDSTVQMINAQRQFDMAMQAIQTYRKLDDRATQVGLVK